MSTDKLADVIAADDRYMDHYAEAAAARVRAAFVVIDREDLPEVVPDGEGDVLVGGVDRYVLGHLTPAALHDFVVRHLAVADYLRKNPPVDEKAVRELAAFLDNEGLCVPNDGLALRMVKAGWKRKVTP